METNNANYQLAAQVEKPPSLIQKLITLLINIFNALCI